MANTEGEICETRDNCLVSRFEWKIPRIKSVLPKLGDICDSPRNEFCYAEWLLRVRHSWPSNSRHCMSVHIIRLGKTINHKNHVAFQLIIINSDGTEYFAPEQVLTAHERMWHKGVTFDFNGTHFSWLDQREFDLKLICSLKCFDCKTTTQEVRSKCT